MQNQGLIQTSTGELRERGEITIPKKIRDEFNLESGQAIAFIPIGTDAILMTPKRLELEEARRQIRNILKRTGKMAKHVLDGLSEARADTFNKHYSRAK